ncbi:FAD:protein FMN transferase [Marinifilum caeruleilacunae]|uniref:FAD:protein FMN transferase n=1 Tax=Marinifilum caeruleilacunae TaxID=2499076 RepID=A0ABX1WZ89_9BACT|nr:FAD:protein FMN transferase [Marinifilum caeruleilacunae]NOU61281.1 FAD:protein FMN transferase [Marinifilum caeruleilacunae]
MDVFCDTFYAMGTRLSLVIPQINKLYCENVSQEIKAEILRIENKLSFFNPNSDVSLINRDAVHHELKIDKETCSLIAKSLEHHQLTGGAFDICKAALKHGLPNSSNNGCESIVLDTKASTICLKSDHLKIDLGGIGKGYALERAKKILLQANVDNALVSFGESSILALGNQPGGNCWKVGLRSKKNTEKFVHKFNLYNSSISISGDWHFHDNLGVASNTHIVDPLSNKLLSKNKLIAVHCESPLEAEILSTALYTKSDEEITSIVQQLKGIKCISHSLQKEREVLTDYQAVNKVQF